MLTTQYASQTDNICKFEAMNDKRNDAANKDAVDAEHNPGPSANDRPGQAEDLHDSEQTAHADFSQADSSQADSAPADAGENDEQTVTVTASQWQQLQQQLNSQSEQVMRIKAEADNQLKREQRQLQRHRQLALESVMRQLLEVRDSMEMGLQASMAAEEASAPEQDSTAAQQLQALRNGMQMTLKLLDKTMTDNHAEIIDPGGQPFDPEWHEAVSMQADSGQPKDTVVKVMQKGCRLHDRLLRPAMVIVAAG